jgi:hypothetical protein
LSVPRLAGSPDAEEITIDDCTATTFAVSAGAAGARYEWRVDGELRPETGPRIELFEPWAGRRQVAVREIGDGGAAGRTWQVDVRAVPPSQAQVDAWLEEYRRAWERKDVAKLRELGSVESGGDPDALEEKLAARRDFEVRLQNVRAESRERAVDLQFDRVDRWKELTRPSEVIDFEPQRIRLERRDCRLVAVP